MHIVAIDCCKHMVATLENVPSSSVISVASRHKSHSMTSEDDVDLVVIGVSRYPVRRLFISQLRQVYPRVPVLILRRVEVDQGLQKVIRGEFVLSAESTGKGDLETVKILRKVLPIKPCPHVDKVLNYDTVREVVRVISENYSNADLDLAHVARELSISRVHLSRILNQQVGVSFRQLLRNTRIEEAKNLLALKKYSVKEVAARVGFSDSHYFSRSFKELTGLSASEYRSRDLVFG